MNPTDLLPQKLMTQRQGLKADQSKKRKQTRRVSPKMGSQRNNKQLKGKKESPERVLNEIVAITLPDIEFKIIVIRKFNELSENYKELQESFKELTANNISMKNDIETINKSQEEVKTTISELRNTVEGIKSRLGEAEY